jgi:gas vesicle protein
MTSPDPDRLRREIEYTQHNLSTDVDLLAEKVTPSRIARRRVDRVRGAMVSARDRVMGSASDTVSTTQDRASSMAADAKEKVAEAPQAVRRGTEGNPIAAGLIAFGAGWLLSTLAPASKPEQKLAGQTADWAREHREVVTEQVGQVAEQVKENIREPAREAVESVKSTAADAAGTVKDEARGAADDVTGRAQEAKSSIQEDRQ